jgi:hypothetical protein
VIAIPNFHRISRTISRWVLTDFNTIHGKNMAVRQPCCKKLLSSITSEPFELATPNFDRYKGLLVDVFLQVKSKSV